MTAYQEDKLCIGCGKRRHKTEFQHRAGKDGRPVTSSVYCTSCKTRRAKLKKLGANPDMPVPSVCEICGVRHEKLFIDHDHRTGRFRGWLCPNCNTAIGKLKEDPIIFAAALRYIASR